MHEITGTWRLRMKTPLGTIDAVYRFTDTGGGLTGTATGAGEEVPLREITSEPAADGRRVTWKQRITKDSIPAERGSFLDRDGNVLAFSTEARQLYANPRMLTDEQNKEHAKDPTKPTADQKKRQIAHYVAQVLAGQVSEQEVLDALFKDVSFTYFGPQIDPSKARQITEKCPQIGSEYRAVREYPAGDV